MTSVEWDAELYAKNTAHHRAYDDHVLDPLDIPPPGGSSTSAAAPATSRPAPRRSCPTARFSGSTSPLRSSSALGEPQRRPNLAFRPRGPTARRSRAGRAPRGKLSGPPFDLVISTATLHWVPGDDHPALYRSVRRLLRPGGVFRAEFGGAGQMADTRSVLDEESARLGGPRTPLVFPEPDEVAAGSRRQASSLGRASPPRSPAPLGSRRRGAAVLAAKPGVIAYRPALGANE